MKYVWPAVTFGFTREPRWGCVDVPQRRVLSLHAIWTPPPHAPRRTDSTVSNRVAVVLQVSIVATPERLGVHANTRSGADAVLAQLAVRVLGPLVVPLNVPPAAGMVVAPAQALTTVVDVVVVVVVGVTVVVVLPAVRVTGTNATLFVSDSSAMRLNGSTVTRST
jgi:hypothetical protein